MVSANALTYTKCNNQSICMKIEHGGHHGHSHGGGLTRNHSRLTELANIDEGEGDEADIDYAYTKPVEKKPIKKSSHGHSHDPGQMNMRGAFLHVLSDALGSIIVVISAMVIRTCFLLYFFNY